jgi:hypothetical protein
MEDRLGSGAPASARIWRRANEVAAYEEVKLQTCMRAAQHGQPMLRAKDNLALFSLPGYLAVTCRPVCVACTQMHQRHRLMRKVNRITLGHNMKDVPQMHVWYQFAAEYQGRLVVISILYGDFYWTGMSTE